MLPEELTGIESCEHLGRAIRLARRERGMSQTRLSEAANVSRKRIYAIETGVANPGMQIMMRLLKALDCTLTVAPTGSEELKQIKTAQFAEASCPNIWSEPST